MQWDFFAALYTSNRKMNIGEAKYEKTPAKFLGDIYGGGNHRRIEN